MTRARSKPAGRLPAAPAAARRQPEPEHAAGEQPAGALVPAGDPVAGRPDARSAADGEPEDIQPRGARAPARLAHVPLDGASTGKSPLQKRAIFIIQSLPHTQTTITHNKKTWS